MTKKGLEHWFLQIPGWILITYLLYAQAIPAINYETGVRMGTQESAQQITEVGVAFFYGFAFSDLVIYIPLLVAGLLGHWLNRTWGRVVLAAALGITAYWPVVCLSAAVVARGAVGWEIDETPYWIVLPAIFFWALWGLWTVTRTVKAE